MFVVLVANIMRQFQQREEVRKAATSEGLLGECLRHTCTNTTLTKTSTIRDC